MPTVNVQIGPRAEKIVKESGFNLCLARDVTDNGSQKEGNVVFSAITSAQLGPNLSFEWEDKYQVFETNSFQAGAQVNVATQVCPIVGGETTTFDDQGSGTTDGVPDAANPFNVVNNWIAGACVGVNHFDVNSNTPTTIFVSSPLLLNMTSNLLPIQKYGIFWNGNLVTNSMYDVATTDPFKFDMTGLNTIGLEYTESGWVITS